MSSLLSSIHLLDPRPDFPLVVSVKQYYDPSTRCTDPDALTLVLGHATGHMKEIWEPCLNHLFALVKKHGLKVNDVWSIELPNHGEAAPMNAKTVEWCYRPVFRSEDYSRAIHAVVTNTGTGIDVDFSQRRLVGIGHSVGALGLLLSTTLQPTVPWEALIAVDVMLVPPTPAAIEGQNTLAASAEKQKDTWASYEDARKSLLKGHWRAWDKRAFETFMKYGLTPVDWNSTEGLITLKTPKLDIAATYRDPHGLRRGYLYFAELVKRIPTHLIYGSVPDVLAEYARADIINIASGGKDKLASVQLVEGAGHQVIVSHPKQLANAIFDDLQIVARSSLQRARL